MRRRRRSRGRGRGRLVFLLQWPRRDSIGIQICGDPEINLHRLVTVGILNCIQIGITMSTCLCQHLLTVMLFNLLATISHRPRIHKYVCVCKHMKTIVSIVLAGKMLILHPPMFTLNLAVLGTIWLLRSPSLPGEAFKTSFPRYFVFFACDVATYVHIPASVCFIDSVGPICGSHIYMGPTVWYGEFESH